ncbi:T9SS type A sorting domain-containing protein [candidate division KSB1 bacterium]|nr:T9SS type A sorting domain-containing protein [candidate division KSB1 bacterium]
MQATHQLLPALFKKIAAPLLAAVLIGIFYWMAASTPPSQQTGALAHHSRVEEKRGPDQRPSEWAWLQRTFPYFKSDPTAHVEALEQAQAARRLAKPSENTPRWQLAGPTNIGGRVSALAINPQNPAIVYAGAATGGVFKSNDRGATWNPIFDEQAVLPIGDIAIDPNNPDVLYVGTGEANGGHNNFPGAGVFKSTDAGATWQLAGLEKTTAIGRIVIDPLNSNRVYVAAAGSYFGAGPDRGVYRSTNAGQTWEKVLFVNDSTGAIDLVIDPKNSETLFAAGWQRVRRHNRADLDGESSGIYHSRDGGNTWQRLGVVNGLPGPASNIGRIGLAICASQPQNLYALYIIDNTYGGLYRSRDGGASWQRTDPDNILSRGFANFSWYFGNVRVHPNNPEQVYVLDTAIMGSFDGGQTWPVFYGYSPSYPGLHVDHHALAFDPANAQRLINGNDGGINISEDAGRTWAKIPSLPVTQFYHITMDQTNPEKLYGGTQDNGTIRTASGRLNDWRTILGGDGFYVIVDPTNPNVIYAEAQNGFLVKSIDGGNSFRSARAGINNDEPANWSTPVAMDPSKSNVLYYGTNRVYRTVDGADHWQPISDDLTDGFESQPYLGTITAIAVAPNNPNVIYAGTDDSHIWVTADLGKTWVEISAMLPHRWVTRVAVDPTDAAIAYATFSGLKWYSPQSHVFRTADMGKTWEDISNNLPDAPVNVIVVDPIYPNMLYVGADVGAFYSRDYGKNWSPLGEGMPVVSVYDIVVHPKLRRLAAGTHGRSMYTLDLSPLTEVGVPIAENSQLPNSPALAQNYPNPFSISSATATTIRYLLPNESDVEVTIHDVLGQKIKTLVQRSQPRGEYTVTWDGTAAASVKVANGLYFVRLRASLFERTRKILVLR